MRGRSVMNPTEVRKASATMPVDHDQREEVEGLQPPARARVAPGRVAGAAGSAHPAPAGPAPGGGAQGEHGEAGHPRRGHQEVPRLAEGGEQQRARSGEAVGLGQALVDLAPGHVEPVVQQAAGPLHAEVPGGHHPEGRRHRHEGGLALHQADGQHGHHDGRQGEEAGVGRHPGHPHGGGQHPGADRRPGGQPQGGQQEQHHAEGGEVVAPRHPGGEGQPGRDTATALTATDAGLTRVVTRRAKASQATKVAPARATLVPTAARNKAVGDRPRAYHGASRTEYPAP